MSFCHITSRPTRQLTFTRASRDSRTRTAHVPSSGLGSSKFVRVKRDKSYLTSRGKRTPLLATGGESSRIRVSLPRVTGLSPLSFAQIFRTHTTREPCLRFPFSFLRVGITKARWRAWRISLAACNRELIYTSLTR